jgi:hypothetical protein
MIRKIRNKYIIKFDGGRDSVLLTTREKTTYQLKHICTQEDLCI